MHSALVPYSKESESVCYSEDFFGKAAIYWHPLFPLLARTFENCLSATNGALNRLKPVAETFKYDAQIFADYIMRSSPSHQPNKEVDSLVVSSISELRTHLLILEQVEDLTDSFCKNFVTNIKRSLSFENIFGREDPFSYSSSDEDDEDWLDEVMDESGRAKRQKLDTDWIRKYSNIIPDFMCSNVKRPPGFTINGAADLPKSVRPGVAATSKDSVVEYRAATQIFQSPEVGGNGTCTAFRSVEYFVWENEMKKSSLPAKPVPVRSQGFREYNKPTAGQINGLTRPEPRPGFVELKNQTTGQLNVNGHEELTRPEPTPLTHPHCPCPTKSAQMLNKNENIERASCGSSLTGNHGNIANVSKCDGFTQTSKNMGTNDVSGMISFSDFSDTVPTRDSKNSIDGTKYTIGLSTLPLGHSQSLMSSTDSHTTDIANLSTTSNGNSTVDCTMGTTCGNVRRQAKKPSFPADGIKSEFVPIIDSVAKRTRSAISSSLSIASTKESEASNKSDSTAQTNHADVTSDFSNKTDISGQSNTSQSQAGGTINVTYASHYQLDTTLDGGNSDTGSGGVKIAKDRKEREGETFIINDADFTVEFAEGQAFELESVTGSTLGNTVTDSDTESFSRECEALISTLKKANKVNRPSSAWDDSRNTKKNLHLLRPFSTPMAAGCSALTAPSDPAERKFVQDLKSWEPSTEGRSMRNRKTPVRNESVQRPPGRGVKYAYETSAILKSWFNNHRNSPYPTQENITSLVAATGLTRPQIRAWFTYRRKVAKKSGELSNLETEM